LICGIFILSAQCSIFVAQMHRTFGFPYMQIHAKVAILFYTVKTKKRTMEVDSKWDKQKWYKAQNIVTAHLI